MDTKKLVKELNRPGGYFVPTYNMKLDAARRKAAREAEALARKQLLAQIEREERDRVRSLGYPGDDLDTNS